MTTIATFLGFFNICAGLMFVSALLAFLGGFIRYLVVLGTERRNGGLVLMFWGVTILFVLVVLLGIVDVLQGPLFFILGFGVAIFLVLVAIISLGRPKPSEPEHK